MNYKSLAKFNKYFFYEQKLNFLGNWIFKRLPCGSEVIFFDQFEINITQSKALTLEIVSVDPVENIECSV